MCSNLAEQVSQLGADVRALFEPARMGNGWTLSELWCHAGYEPSGVIGNGNDDPSQFPRGWGRFYSEAAARHRRLRFLIDRRQAHGRPTLIPTAPVRTIKTR